MTSTSPTPPIPATAAPVEARPLPPPVPEPDVDAHAGRVIAVLVDFPEVASVATMAWAPHPFGMVTDAE